MEQKNKKTTGRDLGDLKARLGLAKEGASTGQQPVGGHTTPSGGYPVVPPMGVPGVQVAPVQQPVPQQDVKRDPFSAMPQAAAAPQHYQPIVDAGPLLDIPAEPKRSGKKTIVMLIAALIPLVIGWWGGSVYYSRLVFNKTIDDAKQIQTATGRLVEMNGKLTQALAGSTARNGGKLGYDPKLAEEIGQILDSAPEGNVREAQTLQEQLFKTNYARMEDVTVNGLFTYYNETLRLIAAARSFVATSERNKEPVEQYLKNAASANERNYGVVFAADQGGYYLGQLVEVGPPKCPKGKQQCQPKEVEGFPVRVANSRDWSVRPGKSKQMNEMVIPIVPDDHWKQVASGKPEYLAFREYVMELGQIVRILDELGKLEKPLTQGLSKMASRPKIFAPI